MPRSSAFAATRRTRLSPRHFLRSPPPNIRPDFPATPATNRTALPSPPKARNEHHPAPSVASSACGRRRLGTRPRRNPGDFSELQSDRKSFLGYTTLQDGSRRPRRPSDRDRPYLLPFLILWILVKLLPPWPETK